MTGQSTQSRRYLGAGLLGATAMMLATLPMASPAPATATSPPTNRTFLVIVLGLEGRYSWQAACLDFTRNEVCTSFGDCGSWDRGETGPTSAFSFEIQSGGDDPPVQLEGEMRIESRGKRESIGGTARATLGDQSIVVALSGRSTTRKRCLEQLELWESLPRLED